MPNATLLMGFPASGKSTIADGYEIKGWIIIDGSKSDSVNDMIVALKNGRNVLIDHTFPTKKSRKLFIDAAKSENFEIHCIHIMATMEDAEFNACMRMIEKYGRLLSPNEIEMSSDPHVYSPDYIYIYSKEFEPPTMDEGFSYISHNTFTRHRFSGHDQKALILDYDNTLRKLNCKGHYPNSIDDIEILPGRSEALHQYKNDGYLLLGVSNQSAIGRNELDEEKAIKYFEHTNKLLGVDIEYIYCPHEHSPIRCFCRKPLPGTGVEFILRHKLVPQQCIFVGDMDSDRTFAERCGFRYVEAEDFFRAEVAV